MCSVVIMPTAVAFRHARVVESCVEPLMGLGVPVREGKNRSLPVLIPGEVIDTGRNDVNSKLRTANAVRMEFTENKDVR